MNAIGTNLKDAYIITNKKFEDGRGFFMESFNLKEFEKITGESNFVQDNHSKSSKGVLRGLHYQIEHPQGKLVRCISGAVYDVIVDLRKSSSSFGKWFGIKLSENNLQLWVPPGFAHGFYTLTETAEIVYKTTDYYYPEYDRTLLWNDTNLGIEWGINGEPILSQKDLKGKTFDECEKYV
ncbi:MAG: dTDP-4-dehydrorhamnose 3,5-epimerase [Nitrosarchaeum sp.]|nr:dTDP-4-dehydrorhamnose 3,5-epimerase [Nitrosarchaeum sp.]